MKKQYLLNPFHFLYQDSTLLSKKPFIQELNQYAIDLENQIAGDFNLKFLISEFAYNQLSFVRNGLILAKVKFLKLYKNYGTFASFCKNQLKKQRWQINDTIRAARVVIELMYAGFETLPTNIAQAVALAKLTEEELIYKWREILNRFPGDKITANKIRNIVNPPKEEKSATLEVPHKVHEDIHREAAERGLSIATFLTTILEFFLVGDEVGINTEDLKSGKKSGKIHLWNYYQNTEDYAERERIWQEDLANLVEENRQSQELLE